MVCYSSKNIHLVSLGTMIGKAPLGEELLVSQGCTIGASGELIRFWGTE